MEFEIVWYATIIRWVKWLLALVVFVAAVTLLVFGIRFSSAKSDFAVICEYRGGEVQGVACIENGRVISRFTRGFFE